MSGMSHGSVLGPLLYISDLDISNQRSVSKLPNDTKIGRHELWQWSIYTIQTHFNIIY